MEDGYDRRRLMAFGDMLSSSCGPQYVKSCLHGLLKERCPAFLTAVKVGGRFRYRYQPFSTYMRGITPI
jgi:hypothetical protein